MTIENLRKEYKLHHIASKRGYESRKGDGHIETYKGKFGEGYVHVCPRFDTTRYVYVEYYTERKE